jgi:hypothetical protein
MQYLAASRTTDRAALVDLVGSLEAHLASYARVLQPDDIAASLKSIEGLLQGIGDAEIRRDLDRLALKVATLELPQPAR